MAGLDDLIRRGVISPDAADRMQPFDAAATRTRRAAIHERDPSQPRSGLADYAENMGNQIWSDVKGLPGELYRHPENFIGPGEMRAPLMGVMRNVLKRGRSGRPLQSAGFSPEADQQILERGLDKVNQSRDFPAPEGESYVVAKVNRKKPVIVSSHPEEGSATAAHEELTRRDWSKWARVNGLDPAYPGTKEAAGEMYDKYEPGPQVVKVPGAGKHVVATTSYDEPSNSFNLNVHGAYDTSVAAQRGAERVLRDNWDKYGEPALDTERRYEGRTGWYQAMRNLGVPEADIGNAAAPWPGYKQAAKFFKDASLDEMVPVIKDTTKGR